MEKHGEHLKIHGKSEKSKMGKACEKGYWNVVHMFHHGKSRIMGEIISYMIIYVYIYIYIWMNHTDLTATSREWPVCIGAFLFGSGVNTMASWSSSSQLGYFHGI